MFTLHQRGIDPLVYSIKIGCFDGFDLVAFQVELVVDSVSLALVHQ
jgi:hypothetical protein